MKNNSITDNNNYGKIRDCVGNSFIINYADYADIQYYMENNSITDDADFRECH